MEEKAKKKWYKRWWAYVLYVWIGISVIVTLTDGSGSKAQPVVENTPRATALSPAQATPAAPTVDKAAAQQKLDSFMDRSKQADLVTSYEFSDSASVVYVGSAWYTLTVVQKKDFIAYVASLKEAVTGYRHFEARDAYSNEKVAEVTAFSGAFEVYK